MIRVAMLGIACRLHDVDTADDLGVAHLPSPVRVGDLAATEHELYRVVDVIVNPPGSLIGAIVKVQPARLAVVSR